MNEFEQRLADAVRAHGDHLFAGLPDWPNSVITVGDGVLRVVPERLNPGAKYPKIYRHHIHVPVDGLVRVQDLVGRVSLGDALLIDAEIIADRPADGQVLGIRGIKHWYDQLGSVPITGFTVLG